MENTAIIILPAHNNPADPWTNQTGTVIRTDGEDVLVEIDRTGVEVWVRRSRVQGR